MLVCTEYRVHRVQSTYYTEYRVQSTYYTEYRVKSTQCRVQSTEYRVHEVLLGSTEYTE